MFRGAAEPEIVCSRPRGQRSCKRFPWRRTWKVRRKSPTSACTVLVSPTATYLPADNLPGGKCSRENAFQIANGGTGSTKSKVGKGGGCAHSRGLGSQGSQVSTLFVRGVLGELLSQTVALCLCPISCPAAGSSPSLIFR